MINQLVQKFKIHLEEDEKSVKTIVTFLESKGVDFNGAM